MTFGTTSALILSIAMAAAFVLLVGGIKLTLRAGDRRRGMLMIVAALVLAANVLIWTWPTR